MTTRCFIFQQVDRPSRVIRNELQKFVIRNLRCSLRFISFTLPYQDIGQGVGKRATPTTPTRSLPAVGVARRHARLVGIEFRRQLTAATRRQRAIACRSTLLVD